MSFGLSETVLTASYDHTKLDADDYEKEVCVQFIQWQHSSTFFWTTYFFPRLVHTSPFCHYRIFGRSTEERKASYLCRDLYMDKRYKRYSSWEDVQHVDGYNVPSGRGRQASGTCV